MTGYEAIASYETAEGAAAATSHLVELGYDEHEVSIEPHAYEVVRPRGFGHGVLRSSRRSAVIGAVIAIAVVTVEAAGVRSVVMAAVVGLGLGAVFGVVVGVTSFVRRRSRRFVEEPDRVRPNRFDVIVSREPERGNHALARWWEPEARPARGRAPT